MSSRALFIASTGQHVGKTTTCLGLFSGMRKRYGHVGFMKAVGQEHVEVDRGIRVDKDVVLFHEVFSLSHPYTAMSPVLFPRGFTRDYLDGKIEKASLVSAIERGYRKIAADSDIILVEGTGHIGVGSIVQLSNAQVAKQLGIPVVIIASGGLGSAFDALALNKALCDAVGVPIAGVILNRVLDEKRTMIIEYFEKALSRWNIPLLGCIPYDPFLSNPSMKDFEALFGATLLSGEEHHMRHFRYTRLVATSLKNYQALIRPSQLIITPAIREDVILATLTKHWDVKVSSPSADLGAGMILTGDTPPKQAIVEELRKAHIPMLYAPVDSYTAMKKISSYTVKIRTEDHEKIQEAIRVVEAHINFEAIDRVLK